MGAQNEGSKELISEKANKQSNRHGEKERRTNWVKRWEEEEEENFFSLFLFFCSKEPILKWERGHKVGKKDLDKKGLLSHHTEKASVFNLLESSVLTHNNCGISLVKLLFTYQIGLVRRQSFCLMYRYPTQSTCQSTIKYFIIYCIVLRPTKLVFLAILSICFIFYGFFSRPISHTTLSDA